MKNMKYLSLLAILGLLVGCTSDLTTEEVPQPPSVPEQKISHVVPVEQALEDLQGLLEGSTLRRKTALSPAAAAYGV